MNDEQKSWSNFIPAPVRKWFGRDDDDQDVADQPEAPPWAGSAPSDSGLRYAPPGVEWSPDDGSVVGLRECIECGGDVGPDGYCSQCGAKAASERDHYREEPAPWVAGVCDRGLRHHRNEDALALAAEQPAGTRGVVVVCDGVSTSLNSDVASLAAAQAARDILAVNQPQGLAIKDSRVEAMRRALAAAAGAANEAVVAASPVDSPGASTTFAAAVIDAGVAYVGNLGDSRVYWFTDDGAGQQLSTDDSMAQARIELGIPREEAEVSQGAHAITRWLGADAPDLEPHFLEFPLTEPGWLLICSDGLWNYASAPEELHKVLSDVLAAEPGGLVAIAEALVAWANEQGGRDNITVALARPLGEVPADREEPAQDSDAQEPGGWLTTPAPDEAAAADAGVDASATPAEAAAAGAADSDTDDTDGGAGEDQTQGEQILDAPTVETPAPAAQPDRQEPTQ